VLARAELNYPVENIPVKQPIKKQVRKKKENLNAIIKILFIITAIIVLVTCLFILSRYAQLTSTRLQLTKLETLKGNLEKEKLNLIGDLENVKSSMTISEDAINKLGMVYPEEGQIVYLSLNDSIVNPAEEFSIAAQIKKMLNLFTFAF
jgi:cell division protein FtsL